ncbi:HNH endonuclease, partial [Parvimonas micra]|uniref:HNH endonuclease n=2 Tax=Parvimonas TaxID=543311 RepID=UPI002B45CEC6
MSGKCKACKASNQREKLKNKEARAATKAYMAQYYTDNKTEILERNALWRKNNPDKMLGYWHNYRAKLRNNGPVDKDITRLKVYDRDQGICKLCNAPCEWKESSIDHRIPISKGG